MNPKILIHILILLFLRNYNLKGQDYIEKKVSLNINFSQNFSEEKSYAKISFQNLQLSIPTLDTCLKITLKKSRKYQIMIEARGYATIIIPIIDDTLSSECKINITVIPHHKLLQEVIVRPDNRLRFKGDTLIIDIESIKVKPHGNTTDLLKKLPSVSIGSWGNIEFMGKSVETITINGRQIFGGNAKATLETIKADMIEYLEITQSKTNQNGIDLNLKLKKGRDNGWFGETTGEYGNENARKEDIRMNRINPKYFLNIFLNENSTSEKTLTSNSSQHIQSMVQYNDMSGAFSITNNQIAFLFPLTNNKMNTEAPRLDKSKGINRSFSGGINFTHTGINNNWYAFALGDFENQFITDNVTQTNIFTEKLSQKQYSQNINHQSIGQIWSAIYGDLKPTKFDIFKTFTLFQWNNNRQIYSGNTKTLFLENDIDTIENNSNKYNNPEIDGIKLIQKFSWTHRCKKAGLISSLFGAYSYDNENVNKGYLNSLTQNKTPITSNHHFLRKQSPEQYVDLQINQSIPIYSKLLLEIKNLFSFNQTSSSQTVLRFSNKEGGFRDTISTLSLRDFQVKDFQNQIHTNLFLKTNRSDLIIGANVWYWKTQRSIISKDYSDLKFLPTLYWKWNYVKGRHLYIYVNSNQQLPNFQQLYPLVDSSSIQQISFGNPYLRNYPKIQIGGSLITSYNSITIQPNINYEQYDNIISINSKLGSNSSIFQNYNQNGKNQRLYLGIRLYRLPRTTVSWSISSNFSINKSITFWENNTTVTNSFNGIFLAGFKWNPNPKISYSLDVKSSLSGISQQQAIFKNDLLLNGEIEISQKTYFNFNTEYAVNRATNNKFFNYPLVDITFNQFVFKNNGLKLGLQVKNLLDIRQIFDSYTTPNSQVEYLYNRMPRFLLISGTFYLERWGK